MTECISPEIKQFLMDMLELLSTIGPRKLEALCNEEAECKLEDGLFNQQIDQAREIIAKMETCSA